MAGATELQTPKQLSRVVTSKVPYGATCVRASDAVGVRAPTSCGRSGTYVAFRSTKCYGLLNGERNLGS
jgi:hypothetical protein